MSCSVYVGNLAATVTEDDLKEKFRIYGKIITVKVLTGYGFVNYDNPFSAQKAILGENDSIYQEKKIAVRLSASNNKSAMNSTNMQNMTNDGPPNKMPKMAINNMPANRAPVVPDQFHYVKPAVASNAPPKKEYPKPASSNRNDCEIIVVSKHLTKYAEHVERVLKSYNIVVDILYPNEEISLGKILSSIASRGCLYAILITSENEQFQSMTVNILTGIPQEHRNIPLDDGMYLISKHFEAFKNGEHSKIGAVSSVPKTEKHPEAIQYLLTLLADCRQLTTLQYDRVIKYLQDKRETQLKMELGDTADMDIGLDYKKNELQNRIMSILNKANTNSSMTSSVASIFDKLQNKSFL